MGNFEVTGMSNKSKVKHKDIRSFTLLSVTSDQIDQFNKYMTMAIINRNIPMRFLDNPLLLSRMELTDNFEEDGTSSAEYFRSWWNYYSIDNSQWTSRHKYFYFLKSTYI